MNDEAQEDRRSQQRREADQMADAMIADLQGQVASLNGAVDERDQEIEALQEELDATLDRLADLQAQQDTPRATSDSEEVRQLVATIRTARANGHPDAAKHVETLLGLLGV